MDEKNLTPTFLIMLEIAEKLRDTIGEINENYNEAMRKVEKIWLMKRL